MTTRDIANKFTPAERERHLGAAMSLIEQGSRASAGSALAKRIARTIFMCGDEPHSKCNRIQFKGGSYPSAETNQGGLCEDALVAVIERALKKPNKSDQPTNP